MDLPHKIHIKIGDFEFNGEGAQDSVDAQYRLFLETIRNIQPATKSQATAGIGKQSANTPPDDADVELDETLLRRVFQDDPKNGLSLKILPKGEDKLEDALMVLLYGFRVLRKEDTVMAIVLTQAARQSGVQAERIDRAIGRRTEYLTSAGRAKGRKYGLNNQGLIKAKEILSKII